MGSSFEWVVFTVSAVGAVLAGVMVILRRNPIHSAMFLVLNFFFVAVIYLLLRNQFIAIVQVMVYAGAIMMLIVFTIMLISVEESRRSSPLKLTPVRVFGIVLSFLFLIELCGGLFLEMLPGRRGEFTPEKVASIGHVKTVGGLLMSRFIFPFELVSLVLLIGIIGAVILVKKER